MKRIDQIKQMFGSKSWFNRIECTNREFVIYSNGYPYTEDNNNVYDYAKANKIKIKIIPIGG